MRKLFAVSDRIKGVSFPPSVVALRLAALVLIIGLLLSGGASPATAQERIVSGVDCASSTATPAGSSSGLVGDCATLLAAKDALRGTATLNWSRDLAIREWDGITVDIGGSSVRVTRLELPGKSLTGVIPPGLGDLAGLERLDLSGNSLTGGLPPSLGKLSRLRALHLHDNRLTGGIPAEYASLNLASVESALPLRFAQTEYSLHPRAFIWHDNRGRKWQMKYGKATPTLPVAFFDEVVVEGGSQTASDLKYAVEGLPDKSLYQACNHLRGQLLKTRKCVDLKVGVGEDSGFLFVKVDEPCTRCRAHYTNDYPTQRMELSASAKGDAPGLKVYREVLVKRPESTPDCSDFPHKNVDRYTCLFLGETLLDEPPSTTEALRDGLPNLVQPKENYDLIFAEEFNGNLGQKFPKGECHDGLATLDTEMWNFENHCNYAYPPTNIPCVNIEDGHLYVAFTSWCQGGVDSNGLFAYKYGYLEVKYTVNIGVGTPGFHIYAVVVGDASLPALQEAPSYGVTMNNYADLAKYVETEVDVIEYVPNNKYDTFHQYGNFADTVKTRDAAPRRSAKLYAYCSGKRSGYEIGFEPPSCEQEKKVTVTKGIEWTPRGYRSFVKVEGVHDELEVLPKEKIKVQQKHVYERRFYPITFGYLLTLSGAARDYFFEHVEHGNADTVLEQVAIAHRPLTVSLNAWGYPHCGSDPPPCHRFPHIRTKMEIDYVRIFQPRNHYADMEPVYK